ncbi:hypothetical protein IJ750_05530 [bacterium]|nr:hypothetical protein [bacterium]
MIRPVDTLSPKVLFKGQTDDYKNSVSAKETKKRVAIVNAAGFSVVAGGLTTIVSRSYTSNWKNAGFIGVCTAAVSMLFLLPQFLYKSGVNLSKNKGQDDMKKKLIGDVGDVIELQKSTVNCTKNIAKKAVV